MKFYIMPDSTNNLFSLAAATEHDCKDYSKRDQNTI